jgi:hypothetical protein
MGGRRGGRRERQRQSRRHRGRFHEQEGVQQAAGQCPDEAPIETAPPRAFDVATEDDELLAKIKFSATGVPRGAAKVRMMSNRKRDKALTVSWGLP